MNNELPGFQGSKKPNKNLDKTQAESKKRDVLRVTRESLEDREVLRGEPALQIKKMDLDFLQNQKSMLDESLSDCKSDLDSAQKRLIAIQFKREQIIKTLKKSTEHNTIWNQLDTYLQMTVLFAVPTFLTELHETEIEKDIKELVSEVVKIDEEIIESVKVLEGLRQNYLVLRRNQLESTYQLLKIQSLDIQAVCMDAFLELGTHMPEAMLDDLLGINRDPDALVIRRGGKMMLMGLDNMIASALKHENEALAIGLRTYRFEKYAHRANFENLESRNLFISEKFVFQAIANDFNLRQIDELEKSNMSMIEQIRMRKLEAAGLHVVELERLPEGFRHSVEGRDLVSNGFEHTVYSYDDAQGSRRYNSIYYKKKGDRLEYVTISNVPGSGRSESPKIYRSECTVDQVVKASRENSRDERLISKVIATNPNIAKLKDAAVRLQVSLANMQSVYSEEATKTGSFVEFMKNQAQDINSQIDDLRTELPEIKSVLDELRVFLGQSTLTPFERDLKARLRVLDDFVLKLESDELSKICKHILSSNYTVDTLGTFFVREAIPFIVSIGVAVAAVAAAFPSGGSSLFGFAAVSGGAGVVGREIGFGISDFTGEIFFGDDYDNLPLIARGLDLQNLVSAYGQQFAYGFAMTFGLLGAGRVIGSSLSKYMSRHAGRSTMHGKFVAQLEKIPRVGYRNVDVTSGSGRQQFLSRFGKEFAEEIGEELTEELASKLDSRLGLLVSIIFCTTTHNVRLHLDGAAVSVLDNSFDAENGTVVSNFGYNYQNAGQVKSAIARKYNPEQITELENGGYSVVVKVKTRKGAYEHKLNFISTNMDTELLSALNPKVREQYGIQIDAKSETISYSKLLLEDNLSLISVLELKGYEVTNLSKDGFLAVKDGFEVKFVFKMHVVIDGIEYRNVGNNFGTYYQESSQPEVYLVKDSVKVNVAKGGETVTPIEDGSIPQIAKPGDLIIQNPLDEGSYIFGYKADGSNTVEQRVAKFNENYRPSPDEPGIYLDRGCRPAKLLTENVTGMASNGLITTSLKGGYMVGDKQGAYTISSEAIKGYRLATLEEINQRLPEVKVQEISEGVFVTEVESDLDMQESGNAYMKSVVEMNLGVSFTEINTTLPHFSLEEIFKFSNYINVMDFDQMSHKEMMNCLGVIGLFNEFSVRQEHLLNFVEKLWDYVNSLEPSIVNAPKFLFVRSFFGSLSKEHEYKSWHRWLNENASQDQLASIFINLGVDQFATTNLLGMFDSSKSVAESVAQPPGIGAHFYTISKFAVDFFIESGETVNSPVSGEVVKVHEFEYDLSLNVMNYFDACKAGKVELSLAGVKENMMIPNDSAARKTLELGQRFLDSQEAGSNFMNGVRDLIDVGADGVEIKDKEGNRHMILHAQALVSEGDMVEVGQPIVRLDYNSGMSSAPHVHYEVNNSDGSPIPMVDTSQNSSDLYQDNLPGLDRYLRSRIPSVDSVQGVESQQLGDFASVDLSQNVSECEFEGYKVTITKASNGQSQARFESLNDASLNGAELDFSVDGEVATIHWMAAGKSGAGQGKMLFDFLLSRYPVVSTGVEGENISYPAVRRLYTMHDSGEYVVQGTGVRTKLNTGYGYKRIKKSTKKTFEPNQHYYVAKKANAHKIPKVEKKPSIWGF